MVCGFIEVSSLQDQSAPEVPMISSCYLRESNRTEEVQGSTFLLVETWAESRVGDRAFSNRCTTCNGLRQETAVIIAFAACRGASPTMRPALVAFDASD